MQEETLTKRKIVISDQVYMKLTDQEYEQCLDLLTFILPKQNPNQKFQPVQIQIRCISKDKKAYSFPAGHLNTVLGVIKRVSGYVEMEIIDRTSRIQQDIPEPSFVLRQSQEDQADTFIHYPQVGDQALLGIINAIPGFGKTISQLAIAHALQLKTLVVTTNVGIRDMWQQEVEKFFKFKPGIIGSGQFNLEPPIVIANIQTVHKHAHQLSREFGLLILDEVHHCPASTFDAILNKSFAQVKLGLSGTLLRKDGKHVLFKGWFGDNVIIPPEENVMIPTILRQYSNQKFQPSQEVGGWANQVTQLYQEPIYIMEVVSIGTQLHFNGYLPLITSDRVEFSKILHQMLEETTQAKWALIISEEKNREQILIDVAQGKYQGVVSTTSIFSEGLSVNPLSQLVLTSSSDNESLVRQLIGRVQRHQPGKRNSIVIDLALRGSTGFRHQESRQKIYRNKKFPLKIFDSLELLVNYLPELK